ncbi:MAG: beta-galactosidase [Actinomyces sp.]|uniref:glycoside hydrolase family 35 protein n=1 Tax=Actinomyces sp. TaxID=29317 RepID=UPI001EB73731|nr:beta-galactosidase family protein [Actinomyces sp.]MBS5825696.1 beta-galactosidase [Actinomyces sp.]
MFNITEAGFELDGKLVQIVSGSMHYFRIHPSQWEERLDQACALGLNTIETYVAWNFHSSKPDEFRLDGARDLGKFLDLAADRGLKAIVRPGPYICAEWDNAGFPAWLTAQDIPLRTKDQRYLSAVDDYFSHVLPIVAERQITRGGNVIMVQVENEYGAFGDDKAYLRATVEMIRSHGINVPLNTCDQANETMLENGSLPEILTTATFGSGSRERFKILRKFQPTGPLMCMEYWNGWFDRWGEHHHVTDPVESANDLAELLGLGASVNFYMLHGGTNFELTNGANYTGIFKPVTTSYDYDAPISEDGRLTEKYVRFQEVLARHFDHEIELATTSSANAPAFQVPIFECGEWRDYLTSGQTFSHLPTFDEVDPNSRYMLYSTEITAEDRVLVFDEVRDRAYCFLDGEPVGRIHRTQRQKSITLPARTGRLDILVEDLGRINYAARIGEPKGLISPCRSETRELTNWVIMPICLERMGLIAEPRERIEHIKAGPILTIATFDAPRNTPLFLNTETFSNGIVWFNGQIIGRYWSASPATTLYIPGPLVKDRANTVLVWEFETILDPHLRFVKQPSLGHTKA